MTRKVIPERLNPTSSRRELDGPMVGVGRPRQGKTYPVCRDEAVNQYGFSSRFLLNALSRSLHFRPSESAVAREIGALGAARRSQFQGQRTGPYEPRPQNWRRRCRGRDGPFGPFPHRSGQAAFPHPAPASGDNAKPYERKRMTDAGMREPALDQALHPLPGDLDSLASTSESFSP